MTEDQFYAMADAEEQRIRDKFAQDHKCPTCSKTVDSIGESGMCASCDESYEKWCKEMASEIGPRTCSVCGTPVRRPAIH